MRMTGKRFAVLMLAFVTVLVFALALPAAAETGEFGDVEKDAWYAEAVRFCQEKGLMSGVSDTRFEPEGTLTRAQLAAILWRQEGSPVVNYLMRFSDVPEGEWYTEAVRWAASEGLVNGYGNGLYGSGDAVTQEQLALIFRRFAEADVTGEIPGFTGDAVPATRAQAAAALMACARRQETAPAPEEGRILVAYFSNTGNTENIAEHLADILGADTWEITAETAYSAADLNYNDSSSRANREQNDPDARPAISGSVADMERYDVVFLGYPIWWGQAPRIISTFLEGYDLAGKTIVPFCTSGSSGIGTSAEALHALAASAEWLDGRRFSGGASRGEVEEWVNGLGLTVRKADGTIEGDAAVLHITINDMTLTASLEDNSSAAALRELLAEGPVTIDMQDYAGMEKVGALGAELPENNEEVTTQAGDLILYQGDRFVIYYAPNTWSLTRLGRIDGVSAEELRELLGGGDVRATLSLGK